MLPRKSWGNKNTFSSISSPLIRLPQTKPLIIHPSEIYWNPLLIFCSIEFFKKNSLVPELKILLVNVNVNVNLSANENGPLQVPVLFRYVYWEDFCSGTQLMSDFTKVLKFKFQKQFLVAFSWTEIARKSMEVKTEYYLVLKHFEYHLDCRIRIHSFETFIN